MRCTSCRRLQGFNSRVWTPKTYVFKPWIRVLQAAELERCGPFEFAAAVNVALSKGGAPQSPLDALMDSVRPALGPALGSYLGGGGGAAFRQPPIVESAVGPPAKSFPLHLVHSGRCEKKKLSLEAEGLRDLLATLKARCSPLYYTARPPQWSDLEL